MREREQRAEARSIARLLRPRSVAVVGASNDEGKIGHAVFDNLLRMGFDGPAVPGQPRRPARRRRARLPEPCSTCPTTIDLVVIAVPAASVPGVVEQCAERGVRGLVVISGGFGERGDAGRARRPGAAAQRELVAAARAHGMRVVGPNCLGIVNTEPGGPAQRVAGAAAAAARAGRLLLASPARSAWRSSARRPGAGSGVSTFVSAGNRADVSGNDLLQYWETDDATDVVLMYLESFGNPRKFARLARRLGRTKPIVAVKSGTAALGARAGADLGRGARGERARAVRGVRRDPGRDGRRHVRRRAAAVDASRCRPATGWRWSATRPRSACWSPTPCAAEGLQLTRLDDVGVDAGGAAFEAALRSRASTIPTSTRWSSCSCRRCSARPATRSPSPCAPWRRPAASRCCRRSSASRACPTALAAGGADAPARGSVPSYPSPERAVRALARAVRYAGLAPAPPGRRAGPDRRRPRRRPRASSHAALADDARRARPDAGRGRPAARRARRRAVLRAAGRDRRGGAAVFDDRSFGALVVVRRRPAWPPSCWATSPTPPCR